MTPFEIEILLHYCTRTDDWRGPAFGLPLYVTTMNWFEEVGLLRHMGENEWQITDRGRFYVEQGLCQVPLPVAEMYIPWDRTTTSAIAKMQHLLWSS